MTKKEPIEEAILYTAAELDTIRGIIRSTFGPLGITPPPGVATRMIILATNLQTLLRHEGFTCTYQPSKRGYSQTIEVVISANREPQLGEHYDAFDVKVSPFTIHLSFTPIGSIEELVPRLLDLQVRYQKAIAEREKWLKVIDQCHGCHYSDKDVEYCGRGLEMVIDCSGYKWRGSE